MFSCLDKVGSHLHTGGKYNHGLFIGSLSCLVYCMKNMGPRTEPWGAPYTSCDGCDRDLPMQTD